MNGNAIGTLEERALSAAAEAWAAAREAHNLAGEAARLAAEEYRRRPTTAAWELHHVASAACERAAVAEGRARLTLECVRAIAAA